MTPSSKTFVFRALFAAGLLLAIGAVDRSTLAIERLKVGETIPAFSLPRADGLEEVTSEQVAGKPVVMVFWRPGQELSLGALRDLGAIAGEIGAEKLEVLAVDSSQSTAESVKESLAGETLPFPVVLDPGRQLYGQVGVIAAPTTLVLDAEGTLRFVLASHPRAYRQIIRARLRFLLGELTEEQMDQEIEPVVLKIDENLAAALRMYNLGRRLQGEGKSKEAFSVFEEAVSRYPSLSDARCALGFLKLSEGDLESAGKHFQTALAHAPSSSLARLGKAAVLARTARADEAEGILLSLLGNPAVAVRARYELGRIYQARGESDRAVAFYGDALARVFPEAPPAAGAQPEVSTPTAAVPGTPATAPPSAAAHPVSPEPAVSPGAVPVAALEASPSPSVDPIVPPADARFLGVKGCKKCHFQQWKSWSDTKMAQALALLQPGVRAEVKQQRSLDPQKDYTAEASCLVCHTTGFGLAGGYPSETTGDSSRTSAAKESAGVTCEGCHGPGNEYSLVHKQIQDARRKYTVEELHAAGQYEVDSRVCAQCHNGKGPCMAPGLIFDFEARKSEGTHKHYDLQFRTP